MNTQVFYGFAKFLLSPTRFAFERCIKGRYSLPTERLLRYCWSFAFLIIAMVVLFANRAKYGEANWSGWIAWPISWLVLSSRMIEIMYAFLCDARRSLRQIPPDTGLDSVDRLQLLALSYVEVSALFACFYEMFPANFLKPQICNPVDALYFSWATITTTGYGDFLPICTRSRLLAMTETGFGLVLLVFAVGSYFSNDNVPKQAGSSTLGQIAEVPKS